MSRIRIIHTKKETLCVSKGKICINDDMQNKCLGCLVYTGQTRERSREILFKAGKKLDDSVR